MDRLDLPQHGGQVGRCRRDDARLAAVVLVMGEGVQVRMMGSVVVAKDQILVGILVVVAVHPADNLVLGFHQLAEVQARTIDKIEAAAD
jgi:hypothetical protein